MRIEDAGDGGGAFAGSGRGVSGVHWQGGAFATGSAAERVGSVGAAVPAERGRGDDFELAAVAIRLPLGTRLSAIASARAANLVLARPSRQVEPDRRARSLGTWPSLRNAAYQTLIRGVG